MLQRTWALAAKYAAPTSTSSVTRLHRWCLPSSPVYGAACDTMQKGRLADIDNGAWPFRAAAAKTSKEAVACDARDRNFATALLASWHGDI